MPERIRCVPILSILFTLIFGESLLLIGAEGRAAVNDPGTIQLDPRFKPHLGTSYYRFELNGMDIGTGLITIQRDGDVYRIYYEARTNKKIDNIFKARYTGEGIIEIDPLKPLKSELHQRVRSKTKDTTIYFEENGKIITTETKSEEGKESRDKVQETRTCGLILDPVSTVFLLQGVNWDLGKKKVLTVYTGKACYETSFTCVDKVGLKRSGAKKIAWVINQASRNIDKSQEEQSEKKDPGLKIYVSAEGYPDVLKVETTRKIGHVTFTLDRFEPAPDLAAH